VNADIEFNPTTGFPRRIGHFLILEQIGAGGMGVIFRAQDLRTNAIVALKMVKPELAKDAPTRERFMREVRAAAALRENDHIVPVYHADQIILDDGQYVLYFVMPVLNGISLQDRIARARGKPLPLHEQLSFARQIAMGLSVAHNSRMVHRDIKPGNIWLEVRTDRTVRVKLLDFGLARSASDSTLTSIGERIGPVVDGDRRDQGRTVTGNGGDADPQRTNPKAMDRAGRDRGVHCRSVGVAPDTRIDETHIRCGDEERTNGHEETGKEKYFAGTEDRTTASELSRIGGRGETDSAGVGRSSGIAGHPRRRSGR